jgi:PAS domain S-box-containing protein
LNKYSWRLSLFILTFESCLMNQNPYNLNIQSLKYLLISTLFTLGILVSIAFFGVRQVEHEVKAQVAEYLQTTLSFNLEILKLWFKEKELDAEVIAAESSVQEKILRLVEVAEKTPSAEELITSPELIWLRKYFGSASKKYGFVGFVIFNLEGRQIGALLDAPVGHSTLKDKSSFFQQSLKEKTVISIPFQAEVDLPDVHGVNHKNWSTMFVSTPVKDNSGIIQAVLAFRIRPETEFSHLFITNRYGETGETYAFSSEGLMLSDSRFNQQLRQFSLIPPEPWNHSILNIYIKNPRGNLTTGFKPTLPKKDWPLTRMAASATLGSGGVETTPYNDYRGVPVVGAWSWLSENNMGIATEIDASEALHPLYSLRKSFYTLFVFLSLASVLGIFFRLKQVVAERKQRQKELKSLDEQLKTQIILDNVVDAIITIDEYGIIQTFNQGARKLFNYAEGEVVGLNVSMLMPNPDRKQHDAYLSRYLSTKIPHIIGIGREVVGLKKDGTEFPMDLAISQVNLHDRTIFTGVIRDISPRKEFEAALIEAKKIADKANQTKGDFLANMSHEIRTPMNGIIGLTQLAMKTELTSVQYDYLVKIDSSSHNLLTIINDVLDMSKMEAGKLNIEDTEFNLEKVLKGVSDVLSTKIQEKGLELYFDVEDDVPTSLIGDPVRLSQILTNLVSNAVKFTEQGHIIISSRVLEKTQESINLELSVKDTGIGLSQDQIGILFKPFSQVDTSITRNFEGTGLGLTIVKNLVALMGGDIRIESQPEKGSNFIFNIVLKPLSTTEPVQIPEPSFKGIRILVIDDSPFMRDILMAMLRSLEFEATATSRYDEGLQNLKTATQEHPYDLVIIDNQLPDAIGAKVCGQLKNINPEKETKTILISGFNEEDILKDLKTPEFDGFLHKPITRSSLLNMIQHVLGFQEAKEKIIHLPREPEMEDLVSVQGAQILLVEDNKINQQIAREFLQRAGLVVTVVENGQEALEALGALKQNEFDAILMDIQMPVMDGYRATQEIRALPQFKDLPIIAMTANANMEDRQKALASGMNEHIPKPVNRNELIKTITRFISAKPDFRPSPTPRVPVLQLLKESEAEHLIKLSPIPGLDLEDGLKRAGYNEDLYKNLLIQFSNNKSRFLEKIELAIQDKDMGIAAQLLHSLKGVAGTIGAKDLAEKALQIEKKLQNNNMDSEYESILNSAKQSMDLLISGISLLEQKYSSQGVIKISQPLPEYEKLAPLIEELENLILDNDLKSLDYIQAIENTFIKTPIKDYLSPVKDHLFKFHFSQASGALKDMVNRLQTTSSQN